MSNSTNKPNVNDILKKYGSKIEGKINSGDMQKSGWSREYIKFKDEMAPELSRYERYGKSLGNAIKLKVSAKDEARVKTQLEIAHVDLESWQALNLGVMTFIGVFFLGLIISVAVGLIFADSANTNLISGFIGAFPFLFFILSIILAMFLFYFVNDYPKRLANKWRLKASSQMVPAILYIVVYMRHTPNLEKAIAFASQHLQAPLSLDFRKIFYNVEVGKFSTIKESLDNYLESWRDYSSEFIEAFHLIESSLFEPENARRIATLEKSLQVVLDGVYDKMLRFTHDVRSPLTNVYMLGVVLPTLGLALLPLASAMLGGMVTWQIVFVLFDLIIPFFVFFLVDKVLILRPGGYGDSDLLEQNPLYPEYKSNKHYLKAFLICFPLILIGLLPLIFQFTPLSELIGLAKDPTFGALGIPFFQSEKLFGFSQNGPFGVGALFMSMFFPLGIGLFFAIAYKSKTKNLIKDRQNTKDLEKEFNSSLFQLGNRIGNGVPPELVFDKVAESSRGLKTEDFFRRVNLNIRQAGMSVENAIFDPTRGAIIYYPSNLIATSMRVLIESSKKGLNIAAVSLMSISEYVKNIQKITERLNDMLAEIVSDMKSNMTFLAPLLSGVVVGLAAMITAILTKVNLQNVSEQSGGVGFASLLTIFDATKMIPPYYLQIIVGIYLIEIIFILSGALVVIDSGEDKLEKTNKTGKNLMRGMGLYFVVAFVATLALFILTSVVIGSGLTG